MLNKKNKELNEKEKKEGLLILKSKPQRVVFEITNRCNLKCKMCAQSSRKFEYKDLDMNIVKKVEHLIPYTTDVSLFGWGEPLVHKRFLDIFDITTKYPTNIFVLTNGLLLTEDVARHLISKGLRYLNFSVDGAVKETYNKIRRGSDFDKVIANIRTIVKIKKELGKKYPYLRMVFTATRHNIKEFPDFLKLAASLGMNEVKLLYAIAYHEDLVKDSLFFHKELTNKVFDESENIAKKLGLKLTLPDRFSDKKTTFHKPCYRPWEEIYVQCDGTLRACCFNDELMGDLNKESFEDIWNNEKFQEFRKRINSSSPPETCKNCQHFRHIDVNKLESHVGTSVKVPMTKK